MGGDFGSRAGAYGLGCFAIALLLAGFFAGAIVLGFLQFLWGFFL